MESDSIVGFPSILIAQLHFKKKFTLKQNGLEFADNFQCLIYL